MPIFQPRLLPIPSPIGRGSEELERTTEDEAVQTELRQIRQQLDEIDTTAAESGERVDPDNARRIVETSKTVRGKLSRLEARSGSDSDSVTHLRFVEMVEKTEEVVSQFGSSLQKQQLAMLKRELERAGSREDSKAVKRAADEIDALRWRTLFKHDWFWREIFDSLCEPNTPFVDQTQAQSLIAKGKVAVLSGDGQTLRDVVRSLWKLEPQSAANEARERAVRSGLRKY